MAPWKLRKIMDSIITHWQAVCQRIANAARAAGRGPDEIQLLAVSKTFPADAVRTVAGAGQRAFGENFVQEAVAKIGLLQDLALEWHFIGPIQSNKTRPIAEHFAWVHSVERLKIAQRLNDARPPHLPPLNVLLQVNVSGEASKSGVMPGEEIALADAIAAMPRLQLRGLMTIPEPTDDMALARRRFARLRETFDALKARHPVDTLSMGMSDDLEAAIAEGATIVRVGSAIFGKRQYPASPAA
jgi:pyridoxal phosphate enzyme (YggS family)